MFDFSESKLEHASYDRICKRCGLLISIDHIDCPHCTGLNTAEMVHMLNERIVEQEKNLGLGRVFIVVAIVIGLLMFKFF